MTKSLRSRRDAKNARNEEGGTVNTDKHDASSSTTEDESASEMKRKQWYEQRVHVRNFSCQLSFAQMGSYRLRWWTIREQCGISGAIQNSICAAFLVSNGIFKSSKPFRPLSPASKKVYRDYLSVRQGPKGSAIMCIMGLMVASCSKASRIYDYIRENLPH